MAAGIFDIQVLQFNFHSCTFFLLFANKFYCLRDTDLLVLLQLGLMQFFSVSVVVAASIEFPLFLADIIVMFILKHTVITQFACKVCVLVSHEFFVANKTQLFVPFCCCCYCCCAFYQ